MPLKTTLDAAPVTRAGFHKVEDMMVLDVTQTGPLDIPTARGKVEVFCHDRFLANQRVNRQHRACFFECFIRGGADELAYKNTMERGLAVVFAVQEGSEFAAFCQLNWCGGQAMVLHNVMCLPDYRDRGFAVSAVQAAVNWCHKNPDHGPDEGSGYELGIEQLILHTLREGNLQNFFRQFGFVKVDYTRLAS